MESHQINWIGFRLKNDTYWRWYQQCNIRFCGSYRKFEEGDTVEYEMKLLLTEVKNDIEWKFYKQKPDAVIESQYIFRCFYSDNNKLQDSSHIIHPSEFDNNYLNELTLAYCRRWYLPVEKMEIGIQIVIQENYDEKFLNSYTAKLMVKRCLQIWPSITREQISRGLALTEMGQQYLDAQLTNLQAQKVIHKEVDREHWKVVKEKGLTPQPGKLLPHKGVDAAKKKARQWKGTPLL